MYPEHDKLSKVENEVSTISEFMEWLENKGLEICFIGNAGRGDMIERIPIQQAKASLIGEYFGIDNEIIEKEKREMLDNIRRKNKNVQ